MGTYPIKKGTARNKQGHALLKKGFFIFSLQVLQLGFVLTLSG